MGLGDTGRVVGKVDRAVMQDRIGGWYTELFGGQDVVRLLTVEHRVRGGDTELLGGEHVVRGLVAGGWVAVCHRGADDPRSRDVAAI